MLIAFHFAMMSSALADARHFTMRGHDLIFDVPEEFKLYAKYDDDVAPHIQSYLYGKGDESYAIAFSLNNNDFADTIGASYKDFSDVQISENLIMFKAPSANIFFAKISMCASHCVLTIFASGPDGNDFPEKTVKKYANDVLAGRQGDVSAMQGKPDTSRKIGDTTIAGAQVHIEIDVASENATFSNSCGTQMLTQRQLQNNAVPDRILPCPRPIDNVGDCIGSTRKQMDNGYIAWSVSNSCKFWVQFDYDDCNEGVYSKLVCEARSRYISPNSTFSGTNYQTAANIRNFR